MAQSVQEQIGILPAIESERHLVQVGRQMLGRDTMPRSNNSALQKRECVLDSIGVDVTININLALVLDCLVAICESSVPHGARIRIELVSDDYIHIAADILANVLRQSSTLNILSMEKTCFSATLPNANDNLLSAQSMTRLVLMATLDSTDIRFVHLDSTIQHRAFRSAHSSTNTMAEIPRSFVAHADSTLNLICRNPLSRFAEKQSNHEPFRERQMRIVEDGSRSNG